MGKQVLERGSFDMTSIEKELLTLIREHDNPEQAMEIALNLLITFLDDHEEPQCTSSASPQVTV